MAGDSAEEDLEMIGLSVVCLLLACALAAVLWLNERQLRAMELLLLARGRGRAGKVRVTFPTPAARALALEMNALIEESDGARREADAERRELQRNLASFSHDVRTPLAGAQGFLQLYALADDAAERDECVAAAAERLGVMRGLVDQLFEFAKVDEGERAPACEEVDICAVVAEALSDRYPAFAERGWEPAVALPDAAVVVRADGEALARIVGNLLDNCLRHGSGAPRIELRAVGGDTGIAGHSSGSSVEPGAFELIVSNPADHLEALDMACVFDRFYRGDGARQAGGSGLGLAIAANLARAMHMHLSAQASAGVFEITLSGARIEP